MTVTYVPDSADYITYLRSQLRLLVGDTAEYDGPRPGRQNYQDEELGALLRLENNDLNRTAARVFEILSAEWSRLAGSYRLGPESEEMRQAAEFGARASHLRAQYGFTMTAESDGSGDDSGFVDWSSVYDAWVGKF